MRATYLLAAGLLVSAAGCGGPAGPALGQVEGTVRVKGKPAAGIEVRFFPATGAAGGAAVGVTDDAGRYTLSVYDPGSRQHLAGAVVGVCKVVLRDVSQPMTGNGPPPPSVLPARYTDVMKSPLTFPVAAGAQTIDIAAD